MRKLSSCIISVSYTHLDVYKRQITADRYEGLCLKLLDLKKIPETEKWCMRLARQHGNALAAYTCRLKLYFTMGEKEKFFEVLQELKESDIIIDNETLELIRIFS